MQTPRRILSVIAFGLAFLGAPASSAQQASEFRVIVHPDNPIEHLAARELSRIFLRRSTRWEDGTPVLPVDLPTEARARESFSTAVLGRSTSAMVAYWQQQIFSGRGVPPTALENERAVIEYVAERPGAVAYVATGTRLSGVKVVEVTP